MSEWVDLMLDGLVCQQCGLPLEDSHAHPRSCASCLDVGEVPEDLTWNSDPSSVGDRNAAEDDPRF
jgi:hypothetical protein